MVTCALSLRALTGLWRFTPATKSNLAMRHMSVIAFLPVGSKSTNHSGSNRVLFRTFTRTIQRDREKPLSPISTFSNGIRVGCRQSTFGFANVDCLHPTLRFRAHREEKLRSKKDKRIVIVQVLDHLSLLVPVFLRKRHASLAPHHGTSCPVGPEVMSRHPG